MRDDLIPQSFTDVVRGEPTTLDEAINAYLGDPARLQQWIDASVTRALTSNCELRVLPDNYRSALAQDVPEGRACGNCSFYNEEKVQGDKAYCEKWDAYVNGAYYCNAWQPHGDGEAHDEPHDQMDDDEDRADPPAPPSDQVKGSDTNKPDSAKGKTGKIVLSPETVVALQNKSDEHNAAMAESDRPSWTRVRLGSLKAVYRRGSGAFSGSHRPGIGRAQWSMARVNAFLVLARTGKPKNPKYVGDNDLLNSEHPRYSEKKSEPRTFAFNYELRHPGHGDQSVHNPHKGGGAPYAPGAYKKVSDTDRLVASDALIDDIAKERLIDTEEAKRQSVETINSSDLYQNGNIAIFVPKEGELFTAEMRQGIFDGVDKATPYLPEGMLSKDFPLEVRVSKLPSNIGGTFVGGKAGGIIKLNGGVVKNQATMMEGPGKSFRQIPGQDGTYGAKIGFSPKATYGKPLLATTIAHELGHGVQAFNLQDNPFKSSAIKDIGMISKYARKSVGERYAETFAAFVYGQRDAATDLISQKHGWRTP